MPIDLLFKYALRIAISTIIVIFILRMDREKSVHPSATTEEQPGLPAIYLELEKEQVMYASLDDMQQVQQDEQQPLYLLLQNEEQEESKSVTLPRRAQLQLPKTPDEEYIDCMMSASLSQLEVNRYQNDTIDNEMMNGGEHLQKRSPALLQRPSVQQFLKKISLAKVKVKHSTWSKPLIVLAVLLSIILALLFVLFCIILGHVSSAGGASNAASSSSSATSAGSTGFPKINEWADGVVDRLKNNSQIVPNFTEWADGVAQSVYQQLNSQSLPNNVTAWAESVAQIIYHQLNNNNQRVSNVTEWTDGVAQNVFQLLQGYTNLTEPHSEILQTATDSAQRLTNIVNTLSKLETTSTSTAGVVDDMLLMIQELLTIYNDSMRLPYSCKQAKAKRPNSPSGVYLLGNASGGTPYHAYCKMGTLCGSGGGWTRLAYLDMTDATQSCPTGFRYYQTGSFRACGRYSAGCVSVTFPSHGIRYSQICGRVVGYQYGHTDAVNNPLASYSNGLNSYYVDGVSITRGSPRKHVWTLMSGYSGSVTNAGTCPCNTGSTVIVKSFIGSHYFCESGNPFSTPRSYIYTYDALWDGRRCSYAEYRCCLASGLPWFHRNYNSSTTTDYLELRVCADSTGEDTPLTYYEIYVK